MLQFPKWKIALVLLVALWGGIWATPNLLSRDTTDQMPSWWQPVSLGLDLQGGSYLLLEVDTAYVKREHLSAMVETLRATLRKEKVRYSELGISGLDSVKVRISDEAERERVRPELRKLDPEAQFEAGEGDCSPSPIPPR